MGRKPLIGISAGYVYHNYHTEGYYVHQDFIDAVSANGGLPMIIPFTDCNLAIETLKLCDGLIITGGEDVHPKFYGQEPHIRLGPTIPQRDVAEIALVKEAVNTNLPILAVCRGIQVLNVALGGSLYQDIPSQRNESIQHFQAGRKLDEDTHSIKIEKNSHLYKIVGEETLRVNSFHHQSIENLAQDLKVVATAPDGIVEAVEHIHLPFVIGVQFHPEFMAKSNKQMNHLFLELIHASSKSFVQN